MTDPLIGATTASFAVTLSVALTEPVDVAWSTKDGTAKAGVDYQAANGVVTFLPGETEKQIQVTVYGQPVIVPEKTFYITLTPPTNAILGNSLVDCIITVTDEDGVPVTKVVVAQGKRGLKGDPGLSAYEQAVLMGYTGTVEEWMKEIADASQAASSAAASAANAQSSAAQSADILVTVSALNEGQEYFATQTALLASTPTVAKHVAKALDTKKVWLWQKPDANPGTWTDTGFSELDQAKTYADANGMFKPITYAAGVDFNTLTAYGCHTFLNGTAWNDSTNRPEQTAQWGHVLVFPTTANVITQVAIMGNVTKTFAMRLRADTNVWQAWGYFHSFDKIAELIKADFNSYLKPQKTSSTVNLLDPSQVELSKEVRPDGTILANANGAISGLIYCLNKENIYVSGLQANTAPRYYRFLDQNGVFISGGYLNNNIVEGMIPVPANAYSFQISLKQGNTNPLDTTTAQIEYGKAKTSYVAFAAGAITHINQVGIADTSIQFNSTSSSKNLFDKSAVLNGYEVYNDGRVLAQASSITSPLIDVTNMSNITISGLVQNPEIVRYCVFKNAAGTVLSVVQIATTAVQATFAVPTNAVTFQFSVKQRSTSNPDLNIVQVESGTTATTYADFVRGISSINGMAIVSRIGSGSSTTTPSRAIGAKYLMFGDSITQTSDVDNAVFDSTAFRSNWAKFAKDMLKMSVYRNYARSGASFLENVSQEPFQKIAHQVQTAIDNAENPDVIILACGTNDANIKLGTYETAMSKAIIDLDRTYTAEAMRWALYKIRESFPNAVCFYCTQLQRADVETTERATANDLMVKLAKRYGFNIIDCMNESGIVKDFEVWSAAGRYLSDGLHPNVSGQQVQANLIVSEVINRMMY